jgi:polyvinyl alcohol dehydrogenase (cytochrome)
MSGPPGTSIIEDYPLPIPKTLHAALVLLALSAPFARGDDGSRDGDWPMYNHDPLGTRSNSAEHRLRPQNVAGLRVLWSVPTGGVVAGTPAVVGDTVFVGDTSGVFHALDARTGKIRWRTAIPGARLTSSPTVLRGRVVIGDQGNGSIYGLDQGNGRLLWSIKPNSSGMPGVWGSGTQVGENVAFGIASNEENSNLPVDYVFRSRGSVLLLDPQDGRVIWQTFTISDAEFAAGAAGVSVWTTPSYDEESGLLYVGTGNNFTLLATGASDALIALDARTGRIRWSVQRTPDDTWNLTTLINAGPDFDFGDSPQVYRLPGGRKVVGAGQKSGVYHVLDAATGAVINFQPFVPGSTLGGLFSDSAVAGGIVFANGNIGRPPALPTASALIAIKGDASGELWRFPVSGGSYSGIAVANGVVYYKPAADTHLYAINAADGTGLAAVSVGQSNSGPSVAHGRVFLGTGNILAGQTTGSIVGLGLGDDEDEDEDDSKRFR